MKWFDGFPFKSKESMQREKAAFQKRMLPFGEAQKAATLAILKAFADEKTPDDELLFAYYCAKDIYQTNKEEGLELAVEKAAASLDGPSNRLNLKSRRAILVLIRLEDGVTSMQEYPTKEDVIAIIEK